MYRVLFLVALTFLSTPAFSDTQRGIELFNAEKYTAAEQEFRGPVAAGDTVAIRYYANMLYFNRGVDQDRPRAKELLRKAYRDGDTASGTYLASLLTDFFAHFSTGETEAETFARQSEAVELIEATYTGPTGQELAIKLALIFIDSEGQIAPKEGIILWFKRAVREGHGLSAWHLANAYANGNGVKQNPRDAFYWAEYSAFLGHPEAQTIVGEYYIEGRAGPERPDAGLALIVQAAKERDNPAMLRVAEYFASDGDLGMAWRVLDLARRRGMEDSERSKRLGDFLISRAADQSARSIEDYAYNGRFETLIQSTTPDFEAAKEDFSNRIRPYSE
jgi:TPR repeat protein